MRELKELESFCVERGADGGMYRVPFSKTNVTLGVIASYGGGWDHVSVSLKNRCPNWLELDFIKRLFFKDDETVMQIHVPVSDHINIHDNTLHLWRPHNESIPVPPPYMV